MKREIVVCILSIIAWSIISYGMVAFYKAEANPFEWNPENRMVMIIIVCFCSFATAISAMVVLNERK